MNKTYKKIIEEITEGILRGGNMKTYKINDVTLSEKELRKLIKDNPELKEELKEEKRDRWKPEFGGGYWAINMYNDLNIFYWSNDPYDFVFWKNRNCFETKEEAQKHLERLEAINTVTLAIEEANGDWKPDWEDENYKYYISYSHYNEEFFVGGWGNTQCTLVLPYTKSEEIAKQIIKDYEAKLKIIFGV